MPGNFHGKSFTTKGTAKVSADEITINMLLFKKLIILNSKNQND